MRWTSFIAGALVLILAIAGLGWAMRSTIATQHSPETKSPVTDSDIPDELKPETSKAPKDEGVQTANPFTLPESGAKPKAVVDEIKHKFDRLSLGATGHHDFVVRNEGDAPLKLAKGESTCKCTVFNIESKEIPPGGSTKVHLEWKPVGIAKVFEQSANVWTNDPATPKLELTVEGSVVTLLTRVPEGAWIVGTLQEGQSTTVSGVIASPLVDSFEIVGVETGTDNVQVTYEPLDAEGLKRLDARSGYTIKCTVAPNMPVGTFDETVKIHLSLPEAPLMQFSVQGGRAGPYQMIGPGWIQERHTLAMGRCKASEGKSAKVSLFVSAPDDVDLKFEEPVVTPPVLKVSLQKDDKFSAGGGRQRYFVILEAPPGITPGRWSGDTAIKVELTNNHPSVSKAVFKVDFQAD
jgi:hypothetical protein